MEMPPESNPSRQKDVRKIRDYFSDFEALTVQEMESQINLKGGITGRQIAEMVIMSVATAKASFKSFQNAYEDKMVDGSLPVIFNKAYVLMGKEVNAMWQRLSPDSEFPLDGSDIVEWANGKGRETTQDDIESMASFLGGMQRAMMPLREIMTGYARREDPFDGQTFAFVSWMHYVQGVLSTCDCPYMDMGFEEGIDLSDLDEWFEKILNRMGEEVERADQFQQAEDAKMSEDVFDEEISDDLRKMMEDTGTMMQ